MTKKNETQKPGPQALADVSYYITPDGKAHGSLWVQPAGIDSKMVLVPPTLAAAAPELLEAAKDVLDIFGDKLGVPEIPKLRAAIAKAEGREVR